jgi:hypothetical protein
MSYVFATLRTCDDIEDDASNVSTLSIGAGKSPKSNMILGIHLICTPPIEGQQSSQT